MSQLTRAIDWLEGRHNTLQAVAKNDEMQGDFFRGYRKGIEFANKYYAEEIARLRQIIEEKESYMVEDVDLSGGEEHAS